jgi:GxxExxY protein
MVGKAVVNAAYTVHKALGPGLLEKVYEVCFCHVLSRNGFSVNVRLTYQLYSMDWFLMKD